MKKILLSGCYGGGFGNITKEIYDRYKELGGDLIKTMKYNSDLFGCSYYHSDRTDDILIQVIEEFKSKNLPICGLDIEEYDDENFDYEISDYDGMESLELVPIINITKLQSLNSTEEIKEYLDFLNIKYKE